MNKTILAANWKMYLNEDSSTDFVNKMNSNRESFSKSEVILFPSHTCISQVQENIEIENINYYNKISNTFIPAIKFRRNIITKDISLNKLVGSEFYIGQVKVKAHDLCRPCKYLQESLKQKNIIKELLLKGGLRCEILTSGKIFIGDKIE